jgi:hypothetical protein
MARTTYILGAGFSHYGGLPLQSDFTKELLAARDYGSGPSRALVAYLDRFVQDVFDHAKGADAKYWPNLEDMFTCIDLAANSGHHLGPKYSPAKLRTVRRALIVRIMRMLHKKYSDAVKRQTPELKRLVYFLQSIDPASVSFLSLNWDVSLEASFEQQQTEWTVSYGRGISPARFGEHSQLILPRDEDGKPTLSITKIHGSVNWLYCDCCQRVFWFRSSDVPRIADQILTEEEWKRIRPEVKPKARWQCARCSGVELGTRIATFSYRKALDFPMFQISWLRAEEALRLAPRIVCLRTGSRSRDNPRNP